MRKLGVVSAGPCFDVSAIVNDLAEGTYSFNKPKVAFVGERFRMLLALKTAAQQELKQLFVGLAGDVTERSGKIAQSLEASLKADDLKVEPLGFTASYRYDDKYRRVGVGAYPAVQSDLRERVSTREHVLAQANGQCNHYRNSWSDRLCAADKALPS
jgi:hypothetical protein